jgi:hypothetical protein
MLKKSGIFLYCLFALSVAIIGCGGGGGGGNPVGPATTIGTNANLSGTVLFDNAPVPFATVYLYKSEKAHTYGMAQLPSMKGSLAAQQMISDGAYSTTTDATGAYSFVNIPVGQYTLIALRDENHQFVQTGVLLGQVTTINPQLTPTGKITGKVTQTIGSIVQNIAGVFVYINGTSYLAVTDTAGNFVISNVPANALTSSTAYEILVSSTLGTASSRAGVRVNPGSTTDIGTIALIAPPAANYANLSGSLVAGRNVTSAELADQFVVLTHHTDGTIFGTHTDSTGKFQFRVMKDGIYLVLCSDSGYNYSPERLIVNIVNLDNGTVTLSAITVDAAQVQNTGSIVGTVTLAGSPIAGAVVHASGTSLVGVSNSAGQFVIEKVPANTSATPYTLEISSSMGTATAKGGIIVTTGQVTNVGAFTITLPTTGYKTIAGQFNAIAPVTSSELANRLLQLACPDGKVSAAYSDTNGAFSFITTQTGDHRLTVLDNELVYSPKTQTIQVIVLNNTIQTLAQNINAAKPDTTGSISGLVTSGGSPVTGAIISVSGTSLVGISNNAGNFIITRVPANSSSNPYAIDVTSDRGISAPMTGFIVTAGADTNIGEIPLFLPVTGYRYITGRLTAVAPLTASMLTNILIQMQTPDGTINSAFTDNTGAFSIMTAQTGAHNFTVIDSRYDYLPRSQTATVDTLDNGTQAIPDISAAKSQQNVTLSGSVSWPTAPAGWQITEGEVVIQNQSGTANFLEKRLVANTSPANYRFENVPPGNYWISINPERNGYQSGALNITVIAGIDQSGLNLNPTLFAPVIQGCQIMDSTTVQLLGVNFTDSTQMRAIVNDRPLTPVDPWATNAWNATRSFFNISHLPPGEYSVQLEKTLGSARITSNKSFFISPIQPPGSIATSTTNKSVTLIWQNAPLVNEVEILLYAVQVPNPLQIGGITSVTGNSHTFSNLNPGTDYFVRLRSRYNNQFSAYAPDVLFNTEATGLDNIESLALSGTAGQIVFGFEVYNNTAYIAIHNDLASPITLLAYQNMTSPPTTLNVNASNASQPRFSSLAVNSNGVFLTYVDPNGNIALTQFNSTLTSVIASRSLTLDYGFSSPSMATVRSFNNRTFLVTRDGTSVEALELSGLNIVASATIFAYNALNVKSADLAHDPVTNTLYLASFGPGESGGEIEIRAFNSMSLSISNPPIVGRLEEILNAELTVIGACNNLIFCAENSYDYGVTSKFVDARSGFVYDISNSTSFDSDRQHRVWTDYNSEVMSNNVFTLLDNGLSIQQTLVDTVYDVSNNLNRIRLDHATGMMHMLYRDFNTSNLSVYRYNSNY